MLADLLQVKIIQIILYAAFGIEALGEVGFALHYTIVTDGEYSSFLMIWPRLTNNMIISSTSPTSSRVHLMPNENNVDVGGSAFMVRTTP